MNKTDANSQKPTSIRRWTDPSRPFRIASRTARRAGVEFEKQVAHIFERYGYEVKKGHVSDLRVWKEEPLLHPISDIFSDVPGSKIRTIMELKYVVECKMSTTRHCIYISKHQVEVISREASGVSTIICFGFPSVGIRVIKAQDLRLMPSGKKYKLTPRDGVAFKEWLEKTGTSARLRLTSSP